MLVEVHNANQQLLQDPRHMHSCGSSVMPGKSASKTAAALQGLKRLRNPIAVRVDSRS
jgi:hypothetical protein